MKPVAITVEEFSTPSPQSVEPSQKLPAVWQLMRDAGIRHVLVRKEQDILGVLSERDLTTFSQADGFDQIEVQDIMSRDLVTVSPDTPLYEVALLMSQKKVGSTIVTDSATDYVGIFTATDALNALVEVLRGDV
jgi:acetoin utilization protein AcuB